MIFEKELLERANNSCELCTSSEGVAPILVEPKPGNTSDDYAVVCEKCRAEVEKSEGFDVNHLRCLNDSMWNENFAVQVLAYRLLHRIKNEGWPQDLMDMMYMEDDVRKWAESGIREDDQPVHRDVNGVELKAGDSVVLIKDLQVKGSSMVAKRGTAVRNISLDYDNEEYIEGRVDGQQIVIITKYVKKS